MTLGCGHASAGPCLGTIAPWKLHLACVQIILVDPLVQALVDWQRRKVISCGFSTGYASVHHLQST